MKHGRGTIPIILLLLIIFLMTSLTESLGIHDSDYGRIEHVGSMIQPRFNHTATTLQNGKVLVTGGTETGYDSLNSPEMFDPNIKEWYAIEPMHYSRMRHTSTLLPSGKVLIAGGYQGNGIGHPSGFYSYNGRGNFSLDRCEVFDPVLETFSLVSPMKFGRFWQTSVLMDDGRVLMIGGVNVTHNGLTSCEIYDPDNDTWEDIGSLNEPRARFTATLLSNGSVIITGGHNGTFKEPLSTCEVYVPSKDKWFNIAPMNNARGFHSAIELHDGRIMVSGGFAGPNVSDQSGAEIYDLETDIWTVTGSLNTPRHSHFMVPIGSEGIIAYGGSSCTEFYCTVSGLEYYDFKTEEWMETYILVLGRKWPADAVLSDGNVLICGGQTCIVADDTTDIYHLPDRRNTEENDLNLSFEVVVIGVIAVFILISILIRVIITRKLKKSGSEDIEHNK